MNGQGNWQGQKKLLVGRKKNWKGRLVKFWGVWEENFKVNFKEMQFKHMVLVSLFRITQNQSARSCGHANEHSVSIKWANSVIRWVPTSFSLPLFAYCWVVWTAVSNVVSPNKCGRTCKVIMKYHAAVLLTVSFAVAYHIHPIFTLSFVSRQGGCRAICTKNTHPHAITYRFGYTW